MNCQVKIWWDDSVGGYRMTMSYNEALIEAFKLKIPISDRSYDKPTRVWTFTEKWLDPTLALMKALGVATPNVITRKQVEASQSATAIGKELPINDIIVQFIQTLPYDAALSAYRKAAMLLHPDRGGSMDAMTKLNTTWKRIEKEVYKQ